MSRCTSDSQHGTAPPHTDPWCGNSTLPTSQDPCLFSDFNKASLSVWYREHSERIKTWYTYYCHCILKTWRIQGMIRDAKRMKSLENWYLCCQPFHNFEASYWKYCFLAWRADGDPCIQQLLITLLTISTTSNSCFHGPSIVLGNFVCGVHCRYLHCTTS